MGYGSANYRVFEGPRYRVQLSVFERRLAQGGPSVTFYVTVMPKTESRYAAFLKRGKIVYSGPDYNAAIDHVTAWLEGSSFSVPRKWRKLGNALS